MSKKIIDEKVHHENISMKQKWLCTFLPWRRLVAPSKNVCSGK